MALAAAKRYVAEGRGWVVDLDLEKFFDRVNHDKLMGKLAKRVADKRVLLLVREFLKAGVLVNGVVMERTEGTPQGGPLSQLLSNIVPRRAGPGVGAAWASVLPLCRRLQHLPALGARKGSASWPAAPGAEASVRGFVERKLKLVVNRAKSAVARPVERKFLGYRLTADERGSHLQVAPTSVAR